MTLFVNTSAVDCQKRFVKVNCCVMCAYLPYHSLGVPWWLCIGE